MFSNFILKKKILDQLIHLYHYVVLDQKLMILKNLPNNSYGKNCLFSRLVDCNSYCLNIGLGSNWIPVHHLDYLNNVDFRFNKNLIFLL